MINRPTTEERLSARGNSSQGFMRYFLLIMTLTYIGLGVFLWFAPPIVFNLSLPNRRILGGIFVFYGIIRFVRTYQQHFRNVDSQHD
jgi:small neutral amino acid transporter SnatA (MarC family)